MRIGLDISKAIGPPDGVGRYCLQLLKALARVAGDQELWLYALFAPVAEGALRETLGRWPERWRFRGQRSPADDPIDVLHTTAWVVPDGLRAQLLFTCYDLTFLTLPECHTLDNKLHCATGLLKARLADATFLAISQATASELRQQLGVPDERIRIVYPAAAPQFRQLAAADARRQVRDRFDLEGGYLLAVGTLEPRKNLRRLLAAYAELPGDLRRTTPLLIAGGESWGEEDIASALSSRPELASVRVLRRVSDDDLVALYNAATVFAYPSLAEGFGLPVVEAMACGTPVVTSNRSALAEVAGGAARLIDPEDTEDLGRALRQLLSDRQRRQTLREQGLARAAQFSWERTARETLDLYRELALRNSPPAAQRRAVSP